MTGPGEPPISLTKPMPLGGTVVPPPAPPNHPPAPVPGYAEVGHAEVGYPAPGYPAPAPVTYAVPSTTTVVQQSNVEIIVAWIFTAVTLLYMLPWAVAATRRSTNSILIAIATFFLAWTVLGWFVLLVLSFLGPTVHTVRSSPTYVALPPPGVWAHCPTDPPHVRRWWDGRTWTAHTSIG